jgi:hypothetical protein
MSQLLHPCATQWKSERVARIGQGRPGSARVTLTFQPGARMPHAQRLGSVSALHRPLQRAFVRKIAVGGRS